MKPISVKSYSTKNEQPETATKQPSVSAAKQQKITASETKQKRKEALFEQLKKEMTEALENINIEDPDLWSEDLILGSRYDSQLLSKDEIQ